jgi:hypothetical protein
MDDSLQEVFGADGSTLILPMTAAGSVVAEFRTRRTAGLVRETVGRSPMSDDAVALDDRLTNSQPAATETTSGLVIGVILTWRAVRDAPAFG